MLVRTAEGYKHGSKITTPLLSRRPSGEFPCRNAALARAIIPYVTRADLLRAGQSAAGGESGIRTHGTVSRTHAFQACALSHSAISPDVLS